MARKKLPSKLETEHVVGDFRVEMEWLEREYRLLAQKRNTLCFLYNEEVRLSGVTNSNADKLRDWARDANRMETVLQWIAETYQARAVMALKQSKMDI